MNDLNPDNICPFCNGSGINIMDFRVIKVYIRWDETSPIRPLSFRRVDNRKASLLEIQDCDNTRELFNYQPGF